MTAEKGSATLYHCTATSRSLADIVASDNGLTVSISPSTARNIPAPAVQAERVARYLEPSIIWILWICLPFMTILTLYAVWIYYHYVHRRNHKCQQSDLGPSSKMRNESRLHVPFRLVSRSQSFGRDRVARPDNDLRLCHLQQDN
jgi:hypothetical protein